MKTLLQFFEQRSNYTSNLGLKFWWWALETIIHRFCSKGFENKLRNYLNRFMSYSIFYIIFMIMFQRVVTQRAPTRRPSCWCHFTGGARTFGGRMVAERFCAVRVWPLLLQITSKTKRSTCNLLQLSIYLSTGNYWESSRHDNPSESIEMSLSMTGPITFDI